MSTRFKVQLIFIFSIYLMTVCAYFGVQIFLGFTLIPSSINQLLVFLIGVGTVVNALVFLVLHLIIHESTVDNTQSSISNRSSLELSPAPVISNLPFDPSSQFSELQSKMAALSENTRSVEQKLKHERDRAQAIIRSMGEGLITFDKECRFTSINPAAEKLLDIPSHEVIGKKWSEVLVTLKGNEPIPPQDLTFQKTLNTGQVIETTIEDNHYYKTLKGRVFPVTSITAPLKDGNEIIGAVKVFRDVTIEKEQNEVIERTVQERTQEISEKNAALQKARDDISKGWFDLQEEKARLTASISSLALGFILTDSAENIVMVNPVANQILNLQDGVRKFSHIEEILKDSCDLHALHLQCNSEKRTIEMKDIVYGKKYLRIFLAPIISTAKGGEDTIGTVLLLEDTTEAKVLDRSKDEFFSIASHELRTPLTAIRGNTSMILDMYKEKLQDKEVVDMIGDIKDSSVRLIDIVNDFLSVSRLEQGRMQFKKEPFDIVALVNKVFEELNIVKKHDDVVLKLENISNSLPQVLADEDKTKEILINLIGNALKFTEKGEVAVSVIDDGEHVKLLVRDTGRGITPQFQNLLFRKFQQAGESLLTRDTTKGTGLGLYISKLMVEGMGGRIWLEKSEANVGTTFGFTLPKAR